MIIACPACATRYAVPDSAVGVDGRTVRCAKCRHSWFQEGPRPELPVTASPADTAAEPARPTPPAGPAPQTDIASGQPSTLATDSQGSSDEPPHDGAAAGEEDSPTARQFPSVEGEDELPAPPPVYGEEPGDSLYDSARSASDQLHSSFDYAPPFRPRRNTARMWTVAALLFALVSLGAVGAVSLYGPPDWMPFSQPLFGARQTGLVLDFPANRQDRRTLPNGAEYFGASGTITNVGSVRRTVPPILVVLRDAHDRIVYTWELAPPKRQLNPGESVTINEAMTDVPRSAKVVEIGWKPN
ncbi:MAG: MJ0042-type zinc finger domain-containing protein [Novosphingobium sp.]